MFGSTTGGKSGAASAPEKDDEAASKGAKAKKDADCGAACSDHCHDESTSRETSPQWSPSNLHTKECFALLFGIEVTPTIEDGVGSHILPAYAWSEHIIFDIWRYFTSHDPQPYGVSRLLRTPFKGWRIHIRWGLGPVRCLSPGSNHMDWPQSQDALRHAHPTRCQRRS